MPAAPYINDNPYRLLGIGSAVTQAELERAVELADKTVKIGITPASGLMQVFGADMLPQCVAKVQTFSADPMERTIYRIFWPFDYQHLPAFKGTLADLLLTDNLGPTPSFRTLQLRFVIWWVKYLLQPSAQTMLEVLNAFQTLYRDEASPAFLAERLHKDGVEESAATEVGYHAPQTALERMLFVFRRQAVQWWERGEVAALTDLARNLSAPSFDVGTGDKILVDLIACGEQEAARLRALIRAFPGWTPMQAPYQPTEVTMLRELAIALKLRVPAAQVWLQVADDRVRQVAVAMRDQALALAEQKSIPFAVQILGHLQTFPLPEDLALSVRNAEVRLRMDAGKESVTVPLSPIARRVLIAAAIAGTLLLGFVVVVIGKYNGMEEAKDTPRISANTSTAPGASVPDPQVAPVVDPERTRLETERDKLQEDINKRQESIDQRLPELKMADERLRADKKRVNRYSRSAVRAWNSRNDALEKRTHQYNVDVGVYNKKLQRMKEIESRLDAMEQAGK